MKKGWVWPLVPIGVLGFSVSMHVALLSFSATDVSIAVEDNAYQRGVRWDDELEQRRINRGLGWKIEVSVAGNTSLRATIRDRKGALVDAGSVSIEMFHHARASRIKTASMTKSKEPGVFTIELPYAKRGFWRLYFEVTSGETKFTDTVNYFVNRSL